MESESFQPDSELTTQKPLLFKRIAPLKLGSDSTTLKSTPNLTFTGKTWKRKARRYSTTLVDVTNLLSGPSQVINSKRPVIEVKSPCSNPIPNKRKTKLKPRRNQTQVHWWRLLSSSTILNEFPELELSRA